MTVKEFIRQLFGYSQLFNPDDEVEFWIMSKDCNPEELIFMTLHDGYTTDDKRQCEIRLKQIEN